VPFFDFSDVFAGMCLIGLTLYFEILTSHPLAIPQLLESWPTCHLHRHRHGELSGQSSQLPGHPVLEPKLYRYLSYVPSKR